MTADLVISKPLKLSLHHIEFRRAHPYDFNPVGFGWMVFASMPRSWRFGLLGPAAQAFSAFIALELSFVTSPISAFAMKGRSYLARAYMATVMSFKAPLSVSPAVMIIKKRNVCQ